MTLSERFSELIDSTPGYEILFPMLAGIIIACLAITVTKAVYGKFIRAVIKSGAESPETAKTADEIGVQPNFLIRQRLKRETSGLRKIISVTEDGKYYIIPKMQSRAEKVYDPRDASPAGIFLVTLAMIALVLILLKIVPWIVEYVGNKL